jgi:hypothetical protein
VDVEGLKKGETEVQAKLMSGGDVLALLGISVKRQRVGKVTIHAITEAGSGLAPTRVPTAADLQNYLGLIWGKQAFVDLTVTRMDQPVVYDLNGNNICDNASSTNASAEEAMIISTAKDNTADYNIYYVNSYGGPNDNAATIEIKRPTGSFPGGIFIQDDHTNSVENISAHEIGHALGLFGYESTDPLDVMYTNALPSNPCRVLKHDWDVVNK